jgi:pyruvate-formate lyase-activating enzyme
MCPVSGGEAQLRKSTSIWGAGCNLGCSQCQNYATTYDGVGGAVTPQQAALLVTHARQRYGVDRLAISGGEATLNRPWLVGYFQTLKALNPNPRSTTLTASYPLSRSI